MSYLLLIVEPTGQREARTAAEARDCYDRMTRFSADLKSRGLLSAAQSLKTEPKRARVQVRDHQPLVVDGPFAEAKEIIGGFLMLTCKTREEAVVIAGDCPAATWATVEVREVGPCFE